MAKKAKTREDYAVESVVPTAEERETTYSLYCLLINSDETEAEIAARKEGRFERKLWEALKTGAYDTISEAIDAIIEYKEGEPVYKQLADTPEEAINLLQEAVVGRARLFIENREERLRTLFCKEYLAPLLLAGMRGGILVNTWWRAVCYGFSVEPYEYTKETGTTKYNAFPYRSLKEMTENDRRAFLWTVEDFYYDIEGGNLINQLQTRTEEEMEEGEKYGYFKPYPEEGYSREEVAEQHNSRREDTDKEITVESLYESWEYEAELYFPIAIHRLDKAIYYALKYKGTEYKDYIKSLNVEADFDKGTTEEEYLYRNVMKEGHVWHSDE